ncbi:MAG: hypothetical protein HY306_07305 [Nitrosomonadales bacterium]|nr:hypothetical protein [Nitrosomonadales bacterium]
MRVQFLKSLRPNYHTIQARISHLPARFLRNAATTNVAPADNDDEVATR